MGLGDSRGGQLLTGERDAVSQETPSALSQAPQDLAVHPQDTDGPRPHPRCCPQHTVSRLEPLVLPHEAP